MLGTERIATGFLIIAVIALCVVVYSQKNAIEKLEAGKLYANEADKSDNAHKPDASEVFRLRTECAAMGKKVLDSHLGCPEKGCTTDASWSPIVGGYYIRGGILDDVSATQLTNYDARTNHCYVEVSEYRAKSAETTVTLYDGQTGQDLASLNVVVKDGFHFTGMVHDPQHQAVHRDLTQDAREYIDQKMGR